VVELGGAGDDSLQSSNYVRDYFDISLGGADTVNAGGADDVIEAGTGFSADDVINGGDGNDTLLISGVQPAPVIMNSTTLTAVETIAASAGSGVNLVLNNSNVAGLYFGTTLTYVFSYATPDPYGGGYYNPNGPSRSTPAAADVITDFEGLGVAGGDIIRLPSSYDLLPYALNASE